MADDTWFYGEVNLDDSAGQPVEALWSFGLTEAAIFRPSPRVANPRPVQENGNSRPSATATPAELEEAKPAVVKPVRTGPVALTPLSHWEGVIESIGEDGFQARLIPIVKGDPQRALVQFGQFAFDELQDKADVALLQEGSRIYWTLARRRNEWGTEENASIVRLRRVLAAGPARKREAAVEADDLLTALTDE